MQPNHLSKVSGLDPAELGMMNANTDRDPPARWQSVTGSPRQGANMVTDPCENIVRKHGYQSRPPGAETIITAIMAKKAAIAVRKIMASTPTVIGTSPEILGRSVRDHVADCLIPLDGAYARARPGSQHWPIRLKR